MPLYEYQCDSCGHRFEVIRKFSDPPLETCPKCGGHVSKLFSSPAFQFKGSGWYVTDYAKKDGAGSKDAKDKDTKDKDAKDTGAASASGDKESTAAKSETTSTSTTETSSAPAKSPAKD
jgi:putative FmdB family regulatory protein